MATDSAQEWADIKADAEQVWQLADRYRTELRDIYRFFLPFREPTAERAGGRGGTSEGARRTDALFDGTGPSAAFAFVANMKADWMPAFEDFFTLKNGPLWTDGNQNERAKQLQLIARVVHDMTRRNRATVMDEMFADLFAGTGAMVLQKGDSNDPIRGFTVPVAELSMETGPFGNIHRWVWRRGWKVREIEAMFPNAKISEGLVRWGKSNRNERVTVTQYTYYDYREKAYRLKVWTDKCGSDPEIVSEEFRVSPWITPRMFVVPGESMGRGLAHLGLPFVKTANKARELALRAAAFALLGLWTRRHDGVFNPDTAAMVPGAMWKVGSNGGNLGPTIQRLDVPHNFDISSVVIKDEREQIRRVLLDDELPELTDRVRSPTEIAGRMRRYERNRGGATTRLAYELVVPYVQRSVAILGEHGVLPGDLPIDDILTRAEITAPAAAAQKSEKVERIVSWMQIVAGLVGPQMMMLMAKVEEIIPGLARDLNIDERYLRDKAEVDGLKAIIESAVQQAMAAKQQQEQAPPPEPMQAGQEFLDGRM